MSRHTDQNKALARVAGFDVREDSDQPGLYTWLRTNENGALIGGCDSSFNSQDEAWDEVVQEVVGETKAHFDLSSEQWDAMDEQTQHSRVREVWSGEPVSERADEGQRTRRQAGRP